KDVIQRGHSLYMRQVRGKTDSLKAPNSKRQAPEKFQAPSSNSPSEMAAKSLFQKWVARATRCDPPAPVGDPPTGTAARNVAKRRSPLARTVAPVPSGESPDGTGGSPVLPANHFSNTLSETLLDAFGWQTEPKAAVFGIWIL